MWLRRLLFVDGETGVTSPVLLREDPWREDAALDWRLSVRAGNGFRWIGGDPTVCNGGSGFRWAPGGGVLRL